MRMNAVEKAGLCFFLVGLIASLSIEIKVLCVFVGAVMFILGHLIIE